MGLLLLVARMAVLVRSWIKQINHKLIVRAVLSGMGIPLTKGFVYFLMGMAALTASSKAGAWEDQPLLRDTTVVLLSGIAGDAESEAAYQDQLQRWLDGATSAGTKQCLIFCDEPSTLNLPSGFQAKAFEADRDHFMQLPSLISESTNPVTLIIWGHGGRQGTIPVLHVRGPRLTAQDLSSLALKLPRVPSSWVLLFRGSGSFAKALSGTGRTILSSENQTEFSNDPIGMPLLLKLVRANSGASLSVLGPQFGRLIADWYTQRNLARTEEPTLWGNAISPVELAGENAPQEFDKQQPAQDEGQRAIESVSDRGDPQKKLTPTGRKDRTAWEGIKTVEPGTYPHADAVVLSSSRVCVLGNNPAVTTEREDFIQILKAEGKRFGDFDISFAPPQEELEFLACEVLQADGQVLEMDPETIGEMREREPGEYQAARRKFFSLPGVVPGAVVHVRYRTQWAKYPLPRVSMELPLSEELPVKDLKLEVRLSKDLPFHFGFEAIRSEEPTVQRTQYAASYTWQLHDLAPQASEPLQPPRRRPCLMISTFADWRAFADWYAHISKMTDEITPEIRSKAAELTRGKNTDLQKVKEVYEYVSGLRYVAIPLGINSVRPHAAANVLENQFGDCKDKANLLNALLHALNIEADLVLVPRFAQAYEELPGLAFNHAISRVKLPEQTLWLDTTDEICRFKLLPPGDVGRNVLVVDGGTTSLSRVELADPGSHRLRIQGTISCLAPQEPWSGDLSAAGSGYADYQLRKYARENGPPDSAPALLSAGYRPLFGSFALQEQSATEVSALDRDFTWSAKGVLVGLAGLAGDKCALHSPFWVPKQWDAALARRNGPLYLNEGYPLTLDEQFAIQLPESAQLNVLPQSSRNTEAPLRWQIEWKKVSPEKLAARLQVNLSGGELSLDETKSFQQQLRRLVAALASDALLEMPAGKNLNASTNR